jgi:hypothetical protein
MPLGLAHVSMMVLFPDHEHYYCNKDAINNENTLLPEQWCWIHPTYELLREIFVAMLWILHMTCSRLHCSLGHENIAY